VALGEGADVKIKKDDWAKPRSKGQHLTKEEIARIRVAFNCGRRPDDIARELKCSSRITNKYYAMFRDTPHQVSMPKPKPKYREMILAPKPVQQTNPQSRFYKSNFEI
jgi:hypothetical protein